MSFVQFNLLPDIKLEFNRAQRTKRLVYGLSALVGAIAIAVFVLSFLVVDVVQKKLLDSTQNDITAYSQKLKSIPDIEKVLTIQNQLGSLPNLHQQKHLASRLFTYLPQLTPDKVNIGKLDLDTTANTIEIVGTANTVETVNKFVDTIKFTTYQTASSGSNSGNSNSKNLAFSNVILTKIDRNDKEAVYTIDASFDPALFSAAQQVQLVVPNETTTRSVLNAPASANPLFNGDTGTKQNNNQQGGQ